ncbi:MAG: type II toxin-antitoxin system VapC family toxin [Thermoplasmataceae archaeon]
MKVGISKKPVIYLDTNVILDHIRQRNNDSVVLIESIKKRKIKTWTSYYTLFEIADKQKEDTWVWKRVKNKESLDDILRTRYPMKLNKDEMRTVYDHIQSKFWVDYIDKEVILVNLPRDDDWDNVLDLITWHNISIGDAFHVQAAIQTSCDIFVTRDSQLADEIKALETDIQPKLIVTEPKNIEKVLQRNGFMPIFPEDSDD